MEVLVDRIPTEDNVLLEYLPKEYRVLKSFRNVKEAKKWIKENPKEVKELLEKYGVLYLTSIRACYIIKIKK